jgi:repressor LexA
MKGLTQRQREVLNYIQEFIHLNRYAPSYREIQEHFAFSSLGSVHKHLTVLKRKGALTMEKQCSRSIALTQPNANRNHVEIELPFIGYIAGGSSIELFPQSQTLMVPESLVQAPDKTYLLRARGDSLQEELIADGDLLLIEGRQEAQAGETIVAHINQNEIIIKKFYPEGDYARLIGYNAHHQPIILRMEDILIQGIVVGLLRPYR